MDEQMVRERDARAYEAVYETADFTELRRRYKNFVVPWTITFMAWYLAYVACCNWARGFMDHKVVGNINVALIFGLLQFVSTFVIARCTAGSRTGSSIRSPRSSAPRLEGAPPVSATLRC